MSCGGIAVKIDLLRGASVLGFVLAIAGCAASAGPPPIPTGAACDACGMDIRDLHFACERKSDGAWRRYDSVECLVRDGGAAAPEVFLADYDRATLHPVDSMWVVRGDLPSPMGGGYAAFQSRAVADSVAAATKGRVDRLPAFAQSAR